MPFESRSAKAASVPARAAAHNHSSSGRSLPAVTPIFQASPLNVSNAVVQRKPITIYVTGITHLVEMVSGSIMEGEERGEVSEGDVLTINNEDKYRSRRGPNQEIYKNIDQRDAPVYRWFRVLTVNDANVHDRQLYIREDAFVPGEPVGGRAAKLSATQRDRVSPDQVSTSFLNELRPKTKTGKWSSGYDELTAAHHKLGKNVLAWLYEHMTAADQKRIKEALHLDPESQALALTRLGGNLISPTVGEERGKAESGKRTDDPMNNRQASSPGEEFLDLMKHQDGSLTPRSQVLSYMSHVIVRQIWHRYFISDNQEAFVLTEGEATAVIQALKEVEVLNFKLEGELGIPSHSDGQAWTGSGRYTKKGVPKVEGALGRADYERYDKAASERLSRKLKRGGELPSYSKWYKQFVGQNMDEAHEFYSTYVIDYLEFLIRVYPGKIDEIQAKDPKNFKRVDQRHIDYWTTDPSAPQYKQTGL